MLFLQCTFSECESVAAGTAFPVLAAREFSQELLIAKQPGLAGYGFGEESDLCIALHSSAPSPPEDEIPAGQRLETLPELHSKET